MECRRERVVGQVGSRRHRSKLACGWSGAQMAQDYSRAIIHSLFSPNKETGQPGSSSSAPARVAGVCADTARREQPRRASLRTSRRPKTSQARLSANRASSSSLVRPRSGSTSSTRRSHALTGLVYACSTARRTLQASQGETECERLVLDWKDVGARGLAAGRGRQGARGKRLATKDARLILHYPSCSGLCLDGCRCAVSH